MRKARLEYQRRNARSFEQNQNPQASGFCVTRSCVLVGLSRFVTTIRDCVEIRNSENLISYYREDSLVAQIVWWPDEVQSKCEHRLFL